MVVPTHWHRELGDVCRHGDKFDVDIMIVRVTANIQTNAVHKFVRQLQKNVLQNRPLALVIRKTNGNLVTPVVRTQRLFPNVFETVVDGIFHSHVVARDHVLWIDTFVKR